MRQTLRNSLLLCVALSGCEVGPDYHPPQMKLPDSFVARANGDDASKQCVTAIDAAQWWKALGDDELNELIDRAIKDNPQADIALTHLQEARQQEAAALGGALPMADASAGGGVGSGSDLTKGRADQPLRAGDIGSSTNPVTRVYGFDAGWEIDLFGKYRRAIEAAGYDTQATAAARNDVLITVIADTVRAYADMRGLQMQQAVLAKNVETVKQYVDVVRQRYQRGITNELDLSLAERQVATLEAQAAPLDARIRASQYVIAALLGDFPENVANELEKPGSIPQLPEKLDTGVPPDLLRNRPDLREAEQELAAATARIGVAEANLFPSATLTGGTGWQAQELSPGTSFIWSAGPSVDAPILDFGTLDALVNVADLHTHEMLMNYKQKVIGAVEDVDNATSAYVAQQDRLKQLDKALSASQKAVYLASQRYDRGLTDMLNVIDAQRQQFDLEQQYVVAQLTAAEQFIALYKALGSGWQKYQTIPPIRQPQPALIASLTRALEDTHTMPPKTAAESSEP